ncbi:MAG: tetratricopeptide repeat protein [Gemmatimonadetes bacterium]|nr:tetratricopeptide repeat protein [Gemmatimonadota bacterium]
MDVSPDQLVGEAKERFDAEDYFAAIHLLEELVDTGKAFADAHHLLGLSYHMLGHSERALESLNRALGLNPRYIEALMHRALVLDALGRSYDAAQDLARARELDVGRKDGISSNEAAKLANMHAALGEAYVESGATDRAIEQYRRALELGPAFHDLRYRLARLLLDAGRSPEARAELEAVVQARPQFYDARAALGLAAYTAGDTKSARDTWTALQSERPEEPKVRAYLSMLERAGRK